MYLSLNALNLCAFPAAPDIFSIFKKRLDAIGINSIATTIEVESANIIESEIPANTSFANPGNNTIGKNTQTDVAVEAIIGTITSFVPRIAATSAGSLLIWMWSNILSSVTTALSTSDPIASASPISEIKFSEIPCVFKRKKVNAADIGIDIPTTSEALKSFKNTNKTSTAITNACKPLFVTLEIASFTFILLSTIISYFEPDGNNGFIFSNSFFAIFAISTRFPSLLF